MLPSILLKKLSFLPGGNNSERIYDRGGNGSSTGGGNRRGGSSSVTGGELGFFDVRETASRRTVLGMRRVR